MGNYIEQILCWDDNDEAEQWTGTHEMKMTIDGFPIPIILHRIEVGGSGRDYTTDVLYRIQYFVDFNNLNFTMQLGRHANYSATVDNPRIPTLTL